jgi:hypothetical protein
MKNKTKTAKETPITDGDTRPDENIEGNQRKAGAPIPPSKKPTTPERGADVNSLEDYKDAKTS